MLSWIVREREKKPSKASKQSDQHELKKMLKHKHSSRRNLNLIFISPSRLDSFFLWRNLSLAITKFSLSLNLFYFFALHIWRIFPFHTCETNFYVEHFSTLSIGERGSFVLASGAWGGKKINCGVFTIFN